MSVSCQLCAGDFGAEVSQSTAWAPAIVGRVDCACPYRQLGVAGLRCGRHKLSYTIRTLARRWYLIQYEA